MINVLIVDDDAMVAELNYRYVTQLQGFQCSGVASSLQQAKELVLNPEHPIDLILLDVYMQMENGLDLLPVLRSAQRQIDVIIISSASDAETIRKSLHYGVVDYLIKPFQFGRFEEALMNWKRKKERMDNQQYYKQAELDSIIHGGSQPAAAATETKRLPKGLTPQTLRTICQWIDSHSGTEFSTEDLASSVLISRVSCRKYLVWLEEIKLLHTSVHYGVTGRPVYRYRLQPEQYAQLKQYAQD